MDKKLFLYFFFIVSLSNQIYSLSLNSDCHISEDLLALIHQLNGYVKPLAKNEVPIGMEFQLVREIPIEDWNQNREDGNDNRGVDFVINGKIINVNLDDNSPLSRRLRLFFTDDQIDNSSIIVLEFTIDRIPIEECDGKSHLQPPREVGY